MIEAVKTDTIDILLYAAMADAAANDFDPEDSMDGIPLMPLSARAARRIWKRIKLETEYADAKTDYHPVREQLKRAAMVFLVITAIGFTCIMSVDAIQSAVWEFLVQWGEKSIHVQLITEYDVDAPNTILVYKEPIIGEEYNRCEIHKDETDYFIEFESKDTLIVYHQNLLEDYNTYLSNNNTKLYETDVNGYEGFYTKYKTHGVKMVTIVWHDGEYAYSLAANMDFTSLLAIAQSVQ